MFHTSVTVQVGNRSRTLFWTERWLDDMAISTLAPDLIEAVHKKVRKNRLAVEALPNAAWIHDIMGSLSVRVLRQYVNLWSWLSDQRLPDKFVWKWTSNQQYFVSSAYRAFFIGQCGLLSARELRKTTAPPTCKFFMWIALLGHYWIGDRLLRHNLNDDDTCALCTQASKSIHHLLLSCVFSREVWFRTLRSAGISSCTPSTSSTMPDWWITQRKRIDKVHHKGFDSLVVLTCRLLWKERNAWVFSNKSMSAPELSSWIQQVGR
jgi:hypothetical protein